MVTSTGLLVNKCEFFFLFPEFKCTDHAAIVQRIRIFVYGIQVLLIGRYGEIGRVGAFYSAHKPAVTRGCIEIIDINALTFATGVRADNKFCFLRCCKKRKK
jgi:hypothetical protein